MRISWSRVAEIGLNVLGPQRDEAIVYLIERVYAPAEDIGIDQSVVRRERPVAVVFIDDEPAVNWSHRCRYVLVDLETGDHEVLAGAFPPFFKGLPPELRLAHIGKKAPAWAVVTQKPVDPNA